MAIKIMEKTYPGFCAIGLVAFLTILCSSTAQGSHITIHPTHDTTIFQGVDTSSAENYENNSCGAGINSFMGRTVVGFVRRGLIQFDITRAIPQGSTLHSVTLILNMNRTADSQNAAATLHPLLTEWGEGDVNCDTILGGGKGAPAEPGDATWIDARFQHVSWGTPGSDLGAASATASIPPLGTALWESVTNPAMVADVQSWLDNPLTNFGWVIIGDEGRNATTRRFSARESDTPPLLTIDYTSPVDLFACCFPDGACNVTSTDLCTGNGGTPFTTSPTCDPNPCPQLIGACCNPDESCTDAASRTDCKSNGGLFQGAGTACTDSTVNCGLTPFVDALPLPGVVQPVSTKADGTPVYHITMEEVRQKLHRDLPDTVVWGYNGLFPGPTLETMVGQPIEVKFLNNLPATHHLQVDECPHGPNYWQDTSRAVAHLHGGHVPVGFDGLPELDFMPGEFDVFTYPNIHQIPATLWYHDHALGITRLNVYMGLAGYYLLRDTFENSLPLPSGAYEIPLVIQDRMFNDDGTLFYPSTVHDGFFGDKILVNGKVWPYHRVNQGKYRFRLLNGSQARDYQLKLENVSDPSQAIPFTLIGTDGGLISAPITVNELAMASGERLDVVVDFVGFQAGTEILLRNLEPAVPNLPNIMKFIVTKQTGHTAPLPETLRTVKPIPASDATVTRRFRLERVTDPCAGAEWLIRTLDAQGNPTGDVHWDDISEFPILGDTEIWEFENPGNMMHPMHVHLVMFQVLGRSSLEDGTPLPLEPWEINTWKDTVKALPRSVTRIIMHFEDYLGKFPYHCHILDHEDHEMMRQFQTTRDPVHCNSNGLCEPQEDCISCPADCPRVSGASCGNGLCEVGDGEDCVSCPGDCAGSQAVASTDPFCCGDGDGTGPILKCGYAADGFTVVDNRCTTDGFFCRVMPRLAACCGDALCDGQESNATCTIDCAPDGDTCTPTELREVNCTDGMDSDCDSLVDANDPDCLCKLTEPTEVSCSDGIDNDCDGLTDELQDPDCGGQEICFDKVDNNGNQLIDCADPECDNALSSLSCSTGLQGICNSGTLACRSRLATCLQNSPRLLEGSMGDPSCTDGLDNDCDGSTDLADSGCTMIVPPPVRQELGIPDISYENMVEENCRFCHNQDPPLPTVNATYLPDRHHQKVGQPISDNSVVPLRDSDGDGIEDPEYDCLNCHSLVQNVFDLSWELVQDFRDCLTCHDNTPHHITVQATVGNCLFCHGSRVDRGLYDSNGDDLADRVEAPWIPTYNPSLVTPFPSKKINGGTPAHSNDVLAGNCTYCHDADPTGLDSLVQGNRANHHNTGLPDLGVCDWCHKAGEPFSTDPDRIRTCENCHGMPSLHNIANDSDDDKEIKPGIEVPYYGHVGNNEDCWGCHGYTYAMAALLAPESGPAIPNLDTLSLSTLEAGTDTPLTLTGKAFMNWTLNSSTGLYDELLSSRVALTDGSGRRTLLEPTAVTVDTLNVVIPAALSPGNYRLTAVKDDKESNPLVLTVTPPAVINHVTCGVQGYVLIGGEGFSHYLDAVDSGTSVTGDVLVTSDDNSGNPVTATITETAAVVLWNDAWILGRFSGCPNQGSVVVNTVFSSGRSRSSGDNGGKGNKRRSVSIL